MKLTALQETRLKWVVNSGEVLPPNHSIKCLKGKELHIARFEDAGSQHIKVWFDRPTEIKLAGVVTVWTFGYLFLPHWSGAIRQTLAPVPIAPRLPSISQGGNMQSFTVPIGGCTWQQWLDAYKQWQSSAPATTPVPATATPKPGKALKTTWLKGLPIQLSSQDPSKCKSVKAGESVNFDTIGATLTDSHLLVTLKGEKFWVFLPHWELGAITARSATTPTFPGIDLAKLRATCIKESTGNVSDAKIDQLLLALCTEGPKFSVKTALDLAHFLAQVFHESGRLLFTKEEGGDSYYAENEYDQNADGVYFCGRGLMQCTWSYNYQNVKDRTGVDCIANPALLEQYPLALTSALCWWDENNMGELTTGGADSDVERVTRRVNGGTTHLEDRIYLFRLFKDCLK
jgi:putative chitinase